MKKFEQKKSLGLALGGGGIRGLAHIGILDVLSKEGIEVNAISGTSMGSMIGAVFALGLSMDDFVSECIKYTPESFFSLSTLNFSNESLVNPHGFETMLHDFFGEKTFQDCKIPFVCNAVDLESGELVTIREGLIWKAVRASSSLPLILPPVFMNDMLLVDGGIIDDLPLPEARALNPEVLVGITVHSLQRKQKISADIYKRYYSHKRKNPLAIRRNLHNNSEFMLDVLLRTLEIGMDGVAKVRIDEANPDLMIEPILPYGVIEVEKAASAIAIGRKIMRENLDKLKDLLK